MPRHTKPIATICKLFRSFQYRHDLYPLFSDCMEATAISLSNSVDLQHREARERRYLEIVKRYERDVIDTFPKIFSEIILAFEMGPSDLLGDVFNELKLHSAAKGQFFTPYTVCELMAGVLAGSPEETNAIIERNGFIRALEPACGAGAMIIALADALKRNGVNYQRHLHVTAVDIDPRVAHMAYIQFTLMHIPAVVIVGDSLAMRFRESWYTPAHILGGWSAKIARRDAEEAARRLIDPPADDDEGESSPGNVAAPARQLKLF